MMDITGVSSDLDLQDTNVMRARNILSVQLGSLEYEPDLGIDLDYFLSNNFEFQNESFKSYLIEVLANRGIDVASVIETIDNLYSTYVFNLSGSSESDGMIAR